MRMSPIPNANEIGASKPILYLAIKAAITVAYLAILWWLWKPVGAYVTIMMVGGYCTWVISSRYIFWHPTRTTIVAALFGTFMAALVCLSTIVSVKSWWAKLLLGFWGLIAVAYIGSPSHTSNYRATTISKDQLQYIAGAAICTYLLVSACIWLILWLHS